jgi:hypothetical protein
VNQEGTTFDPTPWPLSSFEVYNLTGIGSTPDGAQDFAPAFTSGTKRGLQFRNGAAGSVYNSIVTNTGGETGVEIDGSLTSGAPGFNAIENTNNGLVNVVCTTVTDGLAADADPAGEDTARANGNALALALGGGASSVDQVNPSLGTAADVLVNDDTTFDPTGNASGKLSASLKTAKIDPRVATGVPLAVRAGCPAPRGRGLNSAATYRGAFAPGAALWTTGWSALNEGGLLAN